MGDVFFFASDEVVQAGDLVALGEEEITKVGTQETGPAGDDGMSHS